MYDGEAQYVPNEVVYAPQASYHAQPVYQPAPPAPLPVYTTAAPYTPPPTTTTTTTTTTTPAPAPLEVKTPEPVVYAPVDYAPAPLSYPHNPVWNLVVPEAEHHKIKHLKVCKLFSILAYLHRIY